MLKKIATALENFAHNLLNITQFLFNSILLAGGIVSAVFYATPLLSVLFYGLVSTILGNIFFNSMHRVVDFVANMFNSPETAEVETTMIVTNKPKEEVQATVAVNSTLKAQTMLSQNPVKKLADANTQTVRSPRRVKAVDTTPVAVNEEASPAASLSM